MSEIRAELERLTAPGGPFEIVVEELDGHPIRTFASRLRHISDFIAIGEGHGATDFLVQGAERLSFGGTMERARRLASGLRHRYRIDSGDRVGIIGANAIDWVVAYWAVAALDAVAVPFNAWWTAAELEFAVVDSGCEVVLSDARRLAVVEACGVDSDRIVVWGADDADGAFGLEEALAEAPIALPGSDRRHEDEAALIFYTSGTTGRPKGAPLTHRNVVAGFLNAVAMTGAASAVMDPSSADPGRQIDLCAIPLFHATANLAVMVPFVAAGHSLVFLPPGRFDPEVAGALIESERVTRFGGVPTIVSRVVDSGVWRQRDLSSVRRISFGGAAAPAALVRRIDEAFPRLEEGVIQGYGLTETTAISTLNIGPDYAARPDSVGIAAPTVEIRVVDPDGDECPPGEAGEIWIRGANVIRGYWHRPDANTESFTDGFFHTGDIGHLDADGFLYVTGRAKDMVIRGGENVYAAEVEAALESCPGVAEAAVIGVPHPDLGEEVKAVVVTVDPDVTVSVLEQHARQRLAAFKVPSLWQITAQRLPRSPAGKVLKQHLKGDAATVVVDGDSPL